MTAYSNRNKTSPIKVVELDHTPEQALSFFHVDPAKEKEVEQWLTSKEIGQTIIAKTYLNDNRDRVIITNSDKTHDEMLKLLEGHGENLERVIHKKPFNVWALRGAISIIGQTLHLASASFGVEQLKPGNTRLNQNNPHLKPGMWVRKAFRPDVGTFAVLNMVANVANIIWGGQQESAKNRLRAVKGDVNEALDEHLPSGEEPIDVFDDRLRLRTGPKEPMTAWQKVNQFFRENSVRLFELGFRFVGATALVIPWEKKTLSVGWKHLKKGSVIEAFNAASNRTTTARKNYFTAGLMYFTGKTLALFAKVPDPYEDKEHTWVDTVREKVLFKTGSVIEAAAGALMAWNAYSQGKIGFYGKDKDNHNLMPASGTPHRDWFSTVGGTVFFSGYIVRLFAPYGTRQVNMEEARAHASDMLAKAVKDSPEKVPTLLADTAAAFKDHFHDKPEIEFGEVFTKMMTDLYRYHHVALDNLDTKSDDNPAKTNGQSQPGNTPAQSAKVSDTVAKGPRATKDRVITPAASYKEGIAKTDKANEPQLAQGG